ncbi:TRAP transporter small permease subunit [Oscillibacter hominis]|uniref:TRAP transporter small permease subunit n=1 Tax=Oscillibacter hominis TaxID=2763056 RepID=A0A7G9B6V9_9FIRM|nr:TRAP transporter small permease subunit [Oscillibacter hominis]QNL45290.1 TRAP transporter small permease subunit [Oscillibacter hominis]
MKTIKKLYGWIVELESGIALFLLALAIVLNAYEIFQRNFLGKSFIWIQEYSTLMLLWFALLGMCKIVYEHQDIYVDLFVKKFPKGLQRVIDVIVYALVTAFMAVAILYTWKLFLSQEGNYTIVAAYPLQLRSLALLIGFVTMGLKNCASFVEGVIGLFRKDGEGGAD